MQAYHDPGQNSGYDGQVEDDNEQEEGVFQGGFDHPVTGEDLHLLSKFAQEKAETKD